MKRISVMNRFRLEQRHRCLLLLTCIFPIVVSASVDLCSQCTSIRPKPIALFVAVHIVQCSGTCRSTVCCYLHLRAAFSLPFLAFVIAIRWNYRPTRLSSRICVDLYCPLFDCCKRNTTIMSGFFFSL